MCSKECTYAAIHKTTEECEILSKCKLKPKIDEGLSKGANPIYECLTPLRCALIKKHCPDNFNVMMRMEQHTQERKCEPFYPVNQVRNLILIKPFNLSYSIFNIYVSVESWNYPDPEMPGL